MTLPVGQVAFLTRDEAAEWLRVAPITVYRLVARGLLPTYRIARRMLFKRVDLAAFAESRRSEVTEPPYGRP